MAAGLMGVALLLVAVVVSLGFGVRGMVDRIHLDVLRQDNQRLSEQVADHSEEVRHLSWKVATLVGRTRRLAWVLALDAPLPRHAVPPGTAQTDGEVLSWLAAAVEELVELGDLVAAGNSAPVCPTEALPTRMPLEPSQAVPVALFGRRVSPFTGKEESHHGVTWAAPLGEPVLAAGGGRVMWAGAVRERRANEWTRFGTVVVLDHGGGVFSVYAHLRNAAVRRGQQINRGQALGEVGETGWARVPGLYWEVRWPLEGVSRPVDPALFNLALPIEDLPSRLIRPSGDLDGGFAALERLVRLR